MSIANTSNKSIVAAFDFDGTLTYHDILVPFLKYYFGLGRTAWGLAVVAPWLALDVLRRAPRQQMKERVLTQFLQGVPMQSLIDAGKQFAQTDLKTCLRPDAMKRLRWHQQQKHRCIIVSASIEPFLVPWAQAEGFDDILTSQLAFDSQGRATGRLIGKNCRGQEKVRRLQELLGPRESYLLYAYGDSEGDRELLAFADYAYHKKMPLE